MINREALVMNVIKPAAITIAPKQSCTSAHLLTSWLLIGTQKLFELEIYSFSLFFRESASSLKAALFSTKDFPC
jgi:hypothetical protein